MTFILVPSAVACGAVLGLCWEGLHTNSSQSLAILDRQANADEIALIQMHEHQAVQMMLLDPSHTRAWALNLLTYSSASAELLARVRRGADDPELQARASALSITMQPAMAATARKIAATIETDPEAARRRFLEEYQPAADRYDAEVQWLKRRLDAMAREVFAERERANSRTMLLVASALVTALLVVAALLQLLGRRVERSRAAVETLLEGMEEGMCLVDRHGHLSGDRSQALASMLPGSLRATTLPALLAQATGADPAAIQQVVDMLFAPDDGFFSPFEQTAAMLPTQALVIGPDASVRRVSLQYRPRWVAGHLEAIYLIAIDVTAAIQSDVEGQRERQQLHQLQRAADAQESFILFIEHGARTVQAAGALVELRAGSDPTSRAALARDLHTLKGSAATFAFRDLTSLVHELEDHLLGDGATSAEAEECWRRLCSAWQTETARVLSILQIGHRGATLPVSRARLQAVQAVVDRRADTWLATQLRELDRVPPALLLAPLLTEVRSAVFAQSGCEATVDTSPDSADVTCAEAEAVRPALTHLLQNAVDHGLDTVAQRSTNGKPPTARVLVHSRRRADGGLDWQVSDDGKGIDADTLAAKMVREGHWSEEARARATEADRLNLVFFQGLSSRDSASLTAGRGVGNAAARDTIEARGGTIAVFSARGQGTRFEICMPAEDALRTSTTAQPRHHGAISLRPTSAKGSRQSTEQDTIGRAGT